MCLARIPLLPCLLGRVLNFASTLVQPALRLVMVSTGASLIVDDSGNANPDGNFRFDTDSYIFNLSTKGLQTGIYNLIFVSGNDPTPHAAPFQVR